MAEKEKTEQAQDKGKGLSKKLIFIVAGVLLLLIAAGGAAFFWLNREKPKDVATEESVSDSAGQQGTTGLIGPMVNIEPFIINILDPNGTRYLKAAITLEVKDPKAVDDINQRMPQLQDAILLLVGNKTFNELSDLQGKMQLRSELLERLNKILTAGSVRKIYFTEFVVQ